MIKSVSFSKGKGSLAHNNREFTADNVDPERSKDNIFYKRESLDVAYENCFGKAVEEYNAKQKRKDRRIAGSKGYMDKIRNSRNGEKLFYEVVVQVGNTYDSAVGTEQGEVCKTILDRYMKEFESRNPNLYVFNAVLHCDECTPHLHIDYIPLAREYTKGLSVQNSLDRALKQQGVGGAKTKRDNSTICWENREKDSIAEIMQEYGIEKAADKEWHIPKQSMYSFKSTMRDIDNRLNAFTPKIDYKSTFFNKDKVVIDIADIKKIEEMLGLLEMKEDELKKFDSVVEKSIQYKNGYEKYKEENSEMKEEISNLNKKINESRNRIREINDKRVALSSRYTFFRVNYISLTKVVEELYHMIRYTIQNVNLSENEKIRLRTADRFLSKKIYSIPSVKDGIEDDIRKNMTKEMSKAGIYGTPIESKEIKELQQEVYQEMLRSNQTQVKKKTANKKIDDRGR